MVLPQLHVLVGRRWRVLVQVPRAGYLLTMVCQQCREAARCASCHGQLRRTRQDAPLACATCGALATTWTCPTCGGTRLRAPRVGATRTAEELGRAFPLARVIASTGDRVVAQVDAEPALVIATPGGEPRAVGGYAAAVLLDGDQLLQRGDLRAGEEAFRRWLNATALIRPGGEGGSVLVVAGAAARAGEGRGPPGARGAAPAQKQVAPATPPAPVAPPVASAPVPAATAAPVSAVPAAVAVARAAPEPAEALPEAVTDSEHDEKVAESRKASAQAGSILRVDSKRIDNLLNLVSETVINKATFNQISTRFSELQGGFQSSQGQFRDGLKELFDELPDYLASIQAGRSVKEIKKEVIEKYGGLYASFDGFESDFKTNVAKFRSTAQNLGRITSELQEGVMRIRMVPISQIFSRFPRLVRDLSKSLNKKVNLVIEGEETELDKSVIEDLLDPLMHSVRNALDHGVESPADRRAAGKPEEGTVMLRASNEGNMIIIEIADDGKGIDVEAVRTKAIERGLIHPSKVLTDIESFNLIFDPGFSTAAAITNISGRGVGLDVVKRQIEKLNGSVTVSSQRGKGSKFTIKLPLTLAIIQGLLVRVGRETYSIPITSVIESHRIKPSEIRMIDNYEVFNVRNDVVSLLRLNRLFRIQTAERGDYCFVVIVGTSDKRVGLMVDSLIGEEDVVIKPLRDQFTNSPGIAGASILGDGSVCLIIDVSQLLELGQKKELEERQRLELTIR